MQTGHPEHVHGGSVQCSALSTKLNFGCIHSPQILLKTAEFCSNFCNEKASAISKYTNYSFGECALMMLGCTIGSKYMGECLEGWVVIVTYQGPSKHR